MTDRAARRFPWWVYGVVMALILVVALLPLISVIVAGSVAEANGCTLHEGFSNPCVVNGEDMGETLYVMGVMGWFMIATIPLGGMAILALFGWLFVVSWLGVPWEIGMPMSLLAGLAMLAWSGGRRWRLVSVGLWAAGLVWVVAWYAGR